MNTFAITHQIESNYSFPLTKDDFVIRLRVDKFDVFENIYVIYGAKHQFQKKRKRKELKRLYEDNEFAYYEITLHLYDYRLAYIFEIHSEGKRYYLSSDGVKETYDFNISYYNYFQMAYVNEIDVVKEVSWAKDAIIYEIFVERFNRSKEDTNGDYITCKWNSLPTPKSFYGGTLNGIREKLKYLKQLGVNTIYLTPIFKSPSNHKYDTIDYYQVEPQFGGEIAFSKLVKEVHANGMRLILDAVFNHMSELSSIFMDVKENGKNSKYYDWFVIHGDISKGEYEQFASCAYMPKINTSNLEVQDYLMNIIKHYVIDYKIDGWRLDVSDEVSHNFWKRFRREIKAINPDILITGENWQDGIPYLRGDEFDGIMDYSFTRYINDFLSFNLIGPEEFAGILNTLRLRYTYQVANQNWNLLDSHDTFRFYTQVKLDKNKALLGAAIQLFYVGIPCLYYGDELPLEGRFDPDCRRGMNFKLANSKNSFYQTYKELIKLRSKNKIVKYGFLEIYAKDNVLVLKRTLNKKRIELLMNFNKEDVTIPEGEVILSNNTCLDKIKPFGFVVLK